MSGATSDAAQTKGNILVYSTTVPPGQYEYPKDWFDDDLLSVLEAHGYTVTVTDRISEPEITSSMLANYDQLWILSTDEDSAGHFSQDEINTILGFRQQGNGLLIMVDHTNSTQGQHYPSDANQVANPLGVNFFGKVYHGDVEPISPQFDNHPLFFGVTTIRGHGSEAEMTVTAPVDVVAVYQGDNLIAVLDNGNGRVVFDVAFPRLFDGTTYIGDTQQYIRNIADWLQHFDHTVPTTSDWGLIILALLLLAAGVAVIILRRQTATTR